ncbi:MAG: hypothetical protein WBD40_22810 [Tepidisphaeraceae bacterium]
MPEAGAHLWISQADSDRFAAERVLDPAQHRTYCQTIAKYQQVVEKSIKSIAAGYRDRLLLSVPIGYSHDVARIASALRRPARPQDPADIQHHVNRLLTEHVVNEIKALDGLAPRRPPPGGLHARNTEYPFETIAGAWIAPALQDVFSINDVNRFRQLADRVYREAKEIVSALRR